MQFNQEYLTLINKKNKMDGIALLQLIPEHTVRVAFFDPQYRGILDKMVYGNEGKNRGQKRSSLPQMTDGDYLPLYSRDKQGIVA